ncbi:MAG: hypothetical protein QOJ15_4517 [Bradyrhizobium sp.]|nr:hypothetical protein [Bradyrhizobium sp.]
MSHHFDTDQAKNDPRLNCCDVYLFEGRPGYTVLAMTSNADAGISSPDAFHPEGLYALRIDTDGDAKENVVFKFRFGEPRHARGDEHRHVQSFTVIRADAGQIAGIDGEVIAEGETGTSVEANAVRVYAGLAPELWAADALAFFTTLTNLFSEDKYDAATFQNRQNLFQNRNVMAIVMEVPNAMLGKGEDRRLGDDLAVRARPGNPDLPLGLSAHHASVPVESFHSRAHREVPRDNAVGRRGHDRGGHRSVRRAAFGARKSRRRCGGARQADRGDAVPVPAPVRTRNAGEVLDGELQRTEPDRRRLRRHAVSCHEYRGARRRGAEPHAHPGRFSLLRRAVHQAGAGRPAGHSGQHRLRFRPILTPALNSKLRSVPRRATAD